MGEDGDKSHWRKCPLIFGGGLARRRLNADEVPGSLDGLLHGSRRNSPLDLPGDLPVTVSFDNMKRRPKKMFIGNARSLQKGSTLCKAFDALNVRIEFVLEGLASLLSVIGLCLQRWLPSIRLPGPSTFAPPSDREQQWLGGPISLFRTYSVLTPM